MKTSEIDIKDETVIDESLSREISNFFSDLATSHQATNICVTRKESYKKKGLSCSRPLDNITTYYEEERNLSIIAKNEDEEIITETGQPFIFYQDQEHEHILETHPLTITGNDHFNPSPGSKRKRYELPSTQKLIGSWINLLLIVFPLIYLEILL